VAGVLLGNLALLGIPQLEYLSTDPAVDILAPAAATPAAVRHLPASPV